MFSQALSKIINNQKYIYMLVVQLAAPIAPLLFVFLGGRVIGDNYVGDIIALIAKQYIISYLLFFGSEKILMREAARRGATKTISYANGILMKAVMLGLFVNMLLSIWEGKPGLLFINCSIYTAICGFIVLSSVLIGGGYAKLGVLVKQSFIYLLALGALCFEDFLSIFSFAAALVAVCLLLAMYINSKAYDQAENMDESEKSWFYGESVLIAAQSYAVPYTMSFFLSGEYVTAFFAYTRISNIVAFSGSALVNLFYKDAVFLRKKNIAVWKERVAESRRIMAKIGALMFILGLAASYLLFGYFSSTEFQVQFALIILGAQLVNMAVGPTGLVMIAANKQKLKFLMSLCGIIGMGFVITFSVMLSGALSLLTFIVAYCLSILIPAIWGGWVLQNEIR
ncbi:hypothetical protein S7S_10565 [Isoalcanivorax pacificus W11-5]|uniref:Uncharacterized protein n=1 Tax=Isoalcanivorax pacificus W11-5 TaxID=391936 RepID=A0A0B4XP43_9GAMM|nr:hypothetical protein [Isoalcanivorax pacificus]AJD48525.1 hypothetical protein S7S_10565 [Isoalcanivorax pacificus W11-5]